MKSLRNAPRVQGSLFRGVRDCAAACADHGRRQSVSARCCVQVLAILRQLTRCEASHPPRDGWCNSWRLREVWFAPVDFSGQDSRTKRSIGISNPLGSSLPRTKHPNPRPQHSHKYARPPPAAPCPPPPHHHHQHPHYLLSPPENLTNHQPHLPDPLPRNGDLQSSAQGLP